MPYFRWIKQWWSVLIESRLKQWAGSLKKKVPGSPFPIQLEQESITLQKDFQTKTDFFRIHFVQVHCQPCWQEWSLQKRFKKWEHDLQILGFFVHCWWNRSPWQRSATSLHQPQTLTEELFGSCRLILICSSLFLQWFTLPPTSSRGWTAVVDN